MRILNTTDLIATLCIIAFCLCTVQPALAGAVAVTIDGDNTPFILDNSSFVWGFLRPDDLLKPAKFPVLSNIMQIVPFAALKQDGHVFTWDYDEPPCGFDTNGPALRDETYSVPRVVHGLDNVVSIAGDMRHFVALRRDGVVFEFGRKLSVNTLSLDPCASLPTADLMETPESVHSLKKIIAISAGNGTFSALDREGFSYSWGQMIPNKNWPLELHTIITSANPQKIFVGKDKTSISTNSEYLVAISLKKSAYYWGVCLDGSPNQGSHVLENDTDRIVGVDKILLNYIPSYPNAYLLSSGKVIVLYPPDRGTLLGLCASGRANSPKAPLEWVSQLSTKNC